MRSVHFVTNPNRKRHTLHAHTGSAATTPAGGRKILFLPSNQPSQWERSSSANENPPSSELFLSPNELSFFLADDFPVLRSFLQKASNLHNPSDDPSACQMRCCPIHELLKEVS